MQKLNEFRCHVVAYFNHARVKSLLDEPIEEQKAKQARQSINLILDEIYKIVLAAGVDSRIDWIPPSRVGGYGRNVDILMNLFHLYQIGISPSDAIGYVERAMGIYHADFRNSVIRTVNPFWWIGKALTWFAQVPFHVLDTAGFDTTKAQGTILGRLVKVTFLVAPVVASILTILNLLGWLKLVKAALGISAE